MFRCDICEKVFKEKCYLSGKYAHGEQDFKCEKCDKKMVNRKDTIKRLETYSRGINSFIIILFALLVLVRNDFFRDCAFFIKSLLYPFLKYSLEMSYIAKIEISEFWEILVN